MKSVQELIQLYQSEARTHRDKAGLESDAKSIFWKVHGTRWRNVAAESFGCSIYEIQCRDTLFQVGIPLVWELVDEQGITLNTVLKIVRDARKFSRQSGTPLLECIKREAERTKKGSFVIETDGGKMFRKKSSEKTKHDWQDVTALFDSILERELGSIEPVQRSSLKIEMRAELDALVTQFKARIRRSSASGLRAEVSESPSMRRQLIEAFRVLKLDPPRPGRRPDMAVVKKQHRKLALTYHPDRNPGNPHVTDLYIQVNEAYKKAAADGRLAG